jgi:hypothetical protein
MWNIGELTTAEVDLGFALPTSEICLDDKIEVRRPNEHDVLRIAGKWSVNPEALDEYDLPASLGTIAEAPLSIKKWINQSA